MLKLEGGRDVEVEFLDPLRVFGSGVMPIIFGKLDALSLALSRSVSRECHVVASTDKIWESKLTDETIGEVKVVGDMHTRKAEMAKNSDTFIALSVSFGEFSCNQHHQKDM